MPELARHAFIIVLLLVLAEFCDAEVAAIEPAPKAGEISGRIDKAGLVEKLCLVSRVTNKSYTPDVFGGQTGEFEFCNLPGDACYDIQMTLKDGRVLEGIDLEFVDERLIRLGAIHREKLGLERESYFDIPYTPQDTAAITAFVKDMDDFMEKRRILYIRSKGPFATLLVELLRDREFYKSGGHVIWRVELWYFVKEGGSWRKLPDQEKVLRRERISKPQWDKIHVEYFPQFSVRIKKDGTSGTVNATIPDVPDATRGKLGNSDFTPNGNPIIIPD